MVLHSGDLADNPNISYRLVKELRDLARLTASVRPDGTRRQLVIVAGNHDLPGSKQETCYLDLFDDIPGVHVYTGGYDTLDLSCVDDADPAIRDIIVHAIPHDALAEVDFSTVTPQEGRRNILVTHGTAGGTDLYRRCVGREYAIPVEVLERGWHYGALGHWHKRGPVDTGERFAKVVPGTESHVWYAGSTENSGFGDLKDGGESRGYLLVSLDDRGPMVEEVDLPVRKMIRGEMVEATDLTPDEVTAALIQQLSEMEATVGLAGAIVSQRVSGCPRDLWGLVDTARIRRAAAKTLQHDLRLVAAKPGADTAHRESATQDVNIESEIDAAAERVVPPKHRTAAAAQAKQHLRARANRDAAADMVPGADAANAPQEGGVEEADPAGGTDQGEGAEEAEEGATL